MTGTTTWAYLVTYDLRAPGRDYTKLFEGIQKIATDWAHPLKSVWLIRSSLTQSSIRDALVDHIDRNDVIFVIEVKPTEWASYGLDQVWVNWLKSRAA